MGQFKKPPASSILHFFCSQRNTDSLALTDYYRRLNNEDEDTGKIPIPGGYPQKTAYEIRSGQSIVDALFAAANNHIDQRIDQRIPRKMLLDKTHYRMFRAYISSRSLDPDDGFTYARQGDNQACHILIEFHASVSHNCIICIH